MDARALLADVAPLGPFFAIGTECTDRAGPGWRPVADLHTDPEPLEERIAHVRLALDTDERVAASIAFQGLAARLLSPPLAAVAVHGLLPELAPDGLLWRATEGGPWPLWCGGCATAEVGEDVSALAATIEALVGPLVDAVRAQVPVSGRVLWGNVASAVAAGKRLVGVERPAAARRAARVAAALLDTGPLRGTGERRPPEPPDVAWSFRRRSCCLYYRAPGGGLCGDCVLQRV